MKLSLSLHSLDLAQGCLAHLVFVHMAQTRAARTAHVDVKDPLAFGYNLRRVAVLAESARLQGPAAREGGVRTQRGGTSLSPGWHTL